MARRLISRMHSTFPAWLPSTASCAPVDAGAVTCDAHHMTDPHPEGLGVSTCIELALADSGIERDEVTGACSRPTHAASG